MIRRWIVNALVILAIAVFIGSFPTIAWVRAQQGHGGHVYPSEIDKLAIRSQPADPAQAEARGKRVYEHYCAICHGDAGEGDGFNASSLEPTPRDFTDAEFWKGATDERLHDAVARGGPHVGKSVLMPAWGNTFTEKEIEIADVIVFIRTFAERPKARE